MEGSKEFQLGKWMLVEESAMLTVIEKENEFGQPLKHS